MELDAKSNLKTKLNRLELNTPIIAASGTFGYANEFDDFINIKNTGAIVTKAITLQPRRGNIGKRIMETTSGMINSIGLENMGIQEFLSKIVPILHNEKINFIVNIAGSTTEEYLQLAQICEENNIPAIELNLSCPNVKTGCIEFGTKKSSLYELVRETRKIFSGVLITKLTPNVTSIGEIAQAAQNAGADIISAINTVRAMGIKLNFSEGKFNFTKINGGLSGKAIKPIALKAISQIKEVTEIPIIGMGGISNFNDFIEFIAIGADAVQIGTANFTIPTICEDIADELSKFIKTNGFKSFEELKAKIREDFNNG